jgi:hypothetical protein
MMKLNLSRTAIILGFSILGFNASLATTISPDLNSRISGTQASWTHNDVSAYDFYVALTRVGKTQLNAYFKDIPFIISHGANTDSNTDTTPQISTGIVHTTIACNDNQLMLRNIPTHDDYNGSSSGIGLTSLDDTPITLLAPTAWLCTAAFITLLSLSESKALIPEETQN